MTHSTTAEPTLQAGMIKTGAALMGGGLMLAAAGMALTAITVIRGATAWARQHEVSPTTLAADKFEQVRHATLAGAHAWREHAADSGDAHRPHAR